MAGLCTDLKDKVVIITGASSGIGEGTAVEFAKLGSNLAITGRNSENLQKTTTKCIEAGLNANQVLSQIGDITDAAFRQKLVQETIDKFGKIDVLVNNAGIFYNGSFLELDIQKYEHTFDVNVKSVVVLTQLCIPHLLKTKGSVVNVSSVGGTRSFDRIGYYCMSKSALDQFTKCLALELAPQGVRVNSVNPGMIDTAIFNRAGIEGEDYEQMKEVGRQIHPLGRIGESDEVGRAIVFLASQAASFTTGNLLFVDGGYEKSMGAIVPSVPGKDV